MKTDMKSFGDPARFEIAARWIEDQEPRDRLPRDYGWSMGELRITVGGVVLTQHRLHSRPKDAVQWYLGPVVSWFIRHWKWLMHEEAFTWQTHSGESAALTVAADLQRYIVSEHELGRQVYKAVHEWWQRHALRSADSSALYPDICIRRIDDNIEISWLDRQPEFSPEGFELSLTPGMALLPVVSVAEPLWDFLEWAIASAPAIANDDRRQVEALRAQLDRVRQSDISDLELAHISSTSLRDVIGRIASELGWNPKRKVLQDVPVVFEFDAPTLMFGGLNVELEANDIRCLFGLLQQHKDGVESSQLQPLVSSPSINAYFQPYVHGYELAFEAREALGLDLHATFVDVEQILGKLEIALHEECLLTNSIRGVAIAGEGFSPAILINTNSKFNLSKRGRRFTLLHELCHILYDRSSAKRLSHISGPWASARVEKRANAFAAMFLATPHAIQKIWDGEVSRARIKHLSERFGIGKSALLEHMHNLDLLSDQQFWEIADRRN